MDDKYFSRSFVEELALLSAVGIVATKQCEGSEILFHASNRK